VGEISKALLAGFIGTISKLLFPPGVSRSIVKFVMADSTVTPS